MVLLPDVLNFGKQEGAAPTVGLVVESYRDEVARVFVGKGLEESVVHHAKNRRGCADPKGQRENGDKREAAIPCEASKGDAKVTGKNFHVIFPVGFAALFLEAFEASKFEGGAAACFAGGQAGGDVVSDLLLEVALEFGVEAPFGQRLVPKTAEPAHGQPPTPQCGGSTRRRQRDAPSSALPSQAVCGPCEREGKTSLPCRRRGLSIGPRASPA